MSVGYFITSVHKARALRAHLHVHNPNDCLTPTNNGSRGESVTWYCIRIRKGLSNWTLVFDLRTDSEAFEVENDLISVVCWDLVPIFGLEANPVATAWPECDIAVEALPFRLFHRNHQLGEIDRVALDRTKERKSDARNILFSIVELAVFSEGIDLPIPFGDMTSSHKAQSLSSGGHQHQNSEASASANGSSLIVRKLTHNSQYSNCIG